MRASRPIRLGGLALVALVAPGKVHVLTGPARHKRGHKGPKRAGNPPPPKDPPW